MRLVSRINAADIQQNDKITGDTFSVKKLTKPMMPQQRPPHPGQQQQQRPPQAPVQPRPQSAAQPHPAAPPQQSSVPKKASSAELESFGDMMEDLIGTRAAFMLDDKLSILGKIPVSELVSTIKSLNSGVYAIVLDDIIDKDLLAAAERANVSFLVAMDSRVQSNRLSIITTDDL